ncbi:MAG: DUF1579 family protein [Acidobacteria bacterium]|nr:DUF1579 family protein [Acidobacteriota bacterium]
MQHESKLMGIILVGIICLALPLSAQQEQRPVGPPPGMQGPGRPGPEGRRLAFLVGAWEEKVTYPGETPEQKNEGGTGRWFARPMMGRFLQFNYEGVGPQGLYRAFGVLTYDRETQSYRLFWFDDSGGVGDYRGNFADENTLSLEHRGKVEGRDFRERITYTRVSPTEIRTKIEQAWDAGEYRVYLDAQAIRTGAPPQGPVRREPAPTRPPSQ